MATIPQGGGGSGGSGWVKIADVSVPGGTASDKVFQDAPNNTVLQSAKVTSLSIQLTVRASYPIVDVGGVLTTLPESADQGHYEGPVSVTLAGSEAVEVTVQTANNLPGAIDACDFTVDLPPELLTLAFSGAYPGAQTELKEDDNFQIDGTTDKDIDRVRVLDYEACQLEEFAVAVGTSFSVSGTIADRGNVAVARPARVQVRDATTGAWSATRDTNLGGGTTDGVDVVNCNNLHPTVSILTPIGYPAGQQALKASESATVGVSAANYDSIVASSPNSELNITGGPPSYTATRIAGTYNVTVANFRLVATRNANGAETIRQYVIQIAAVAMQLTVALPAARLRSGGNDGTSIQSHTITVNSDQEIQSFTMDPEAGGGVWSGSWGGSATSRTRTLQVHDDDTKGVYTWQNVSAVNLALIPTTVIGTNPTYTLGGFVARSLTFAAFATQTAMDVEVVDFTKLQAGIFTATSQPALKQAIGTPPSVTNGYTINATGSKPTQVIWLDTAAAGSNSGGTAQITNVQEVV